MQSQRRMKRFHWLLLTYVLGPFALADASDIAGTWAGKFSCEDGDFTWQIAIGDTTPNRFTGQLLFKRDSDGVEGAHNVSGIYKANANRITLNGRGAVVKIAGHENLSFRGIYDSDSGTISGDFVDKSCGSFELSRTSTEVVALFDNSAAPQSRTPKPTQSVQTGRTPKTKSDTYANQTSSDRCNEIREWSNELENTYTGDIYKLPDTKITPLVSNLFDDRHFVPVFGREFDTLDEAQRTSIANEQIKPCFDRYEHDWQSFYLGNAFTWNSGPLNHPDVVKKVLEFRENLAWIDEWIDSLAEMKVNADSYASLVKLKEEAIERLTNMWPQYLESFEEAISSPRQKSAQLALTREVDNVLAAAKSYDDIPTMRRVFATHREITEHAGAAARVQEWNRIEALAAKLIPQAVEDQRKALLALGTGIDALDPQYYWYEKFDRLRATLGRPEALDVLEIEFRELRESIWNDNEKKLVEMMRTAPSTTYIMKNRPMITKHDRHLEAPMRMSEVGWERHFELIGTEREAFMQRWGTSAYYSREPIESLRMQKSDITYRTPEQAQTIDIEPDIYRPGIPATPGGPSIADAADVAGHSAAQAIREASMGRSLLNATEERFQAARRAFFECNDECSNKDQVSRRLRRMWFSKDWGIASMAITNNLFGFSEAELSEAANIFEIMSGGHRPMDASVCRKEIDPWVKCVADLYARGLGDPHESVYQCWDEYSVYDDCRNIAEQFRLENDFMTQAERLLSRGVDEDLAWLAQGVRNHYRYDSHSLPLEKADDYIQCFGEDRMKKLSRKYLHPDASNLPGGSGSAMRLIKAELGIENDNKQPGNPADIWDCSAT